MLNAFQSPSYAVEIDARRGTPPSMFPYSAGGGGGDGGGGSSGTPRCAGSLQNQPAGQGGNGGTSRLGSLHQMGTPGAGSGMKPPPGFYSPLGGGGGGGSGTVFGGVGGGVSPGYMSPGGVRYILLSTPHCNLIVGTEV
jgi:hypothetical protein